MTIEIGTRVRINKTYPYEDVTEPDDVKYHGREGEVETVPTGNRIYYRVRLDGDTYGTLYHKSELDLVEVEPKFMTEDELAEALYNLIVIRGRWGGTPKPSPIMGDDGTWEGLAEWLKETWRDTAARFARENNLRLAE